MTDALVSFDFEASAVRTMMRDDAPWFVLADVCRVLEIGNQGNAASSLDPDEKDGIHTMDTIGRSQKTIIINESGLYSLVLRSRKPAAKRFRKWVTAEVLPSLRRGAVLGQAAPAPQEDNDEDRSTLIGRMRAPEFNALMRGVYNAQKLYGTRAARALWESVPDSLAGYSDRIASTRVQVRRRDVRLRRATPHAACVDNGATAALPWRRRQSLRGFARVCEGFIRTLAGKNQREVRRFRYTCEGCEGFPRVHVCKQGA